MFSLPCLNPFVHRASEQKREEGRDILKILGSDANKGRLSINKERLLKNNPRLWNNFGYYISHQSESFGLAVRPERTDSPQGRTKNQRCFLKKSSTRCWAFLLQLCGMSHSSVFSLSSAPSDFQVSCMVWKAFWTPATGKSLSCEPLMKSIGLGQARLAICG